MDWTDGWMDVCAVGVRWTVDETSSADLSDEARTLHCVPTIWAYIHEYMSEECGIRAI